MLLRIAQARLGDRQMPRVRFQVGIDRVELHVGEVVGLDSELELRIDLLNLVEDVLCLGLLRVDARIGGGRVDGRQSDGQGNGRQEREDHRRLSLARAGYVATFRSSSRGTRVGARSVTSGAP